MPYRYYMRMRVLHIEDEPFIGKLVRKFLSNSYFDVYLECAPTLQEGIALLYSKRWDAILLDLSLPDSLPENTFDRVYEVAPQLPIIVLTGEHDLEIRAHTIAKGAQDCIYKLELSSELLVRVLRFSVERQRTILELYAIIRELEEAKQKLQELIQKVDGQSFPEPH